MEMESKLVAHPRQSGRVSVENLPPSMIRKLANPSRGLNDVIPLWFGEPDRPTPEFICEAAIDSLKAGHTFYKPNLGIEPLRVALADYTNGLYETRFGPENIVVTNSGLVALGLASQCVVNEGDTVVTHAPMWPNLPAIQEVLGAQVVRVPLEMRSGAWRLDLDRLFAACTPETTMMMINSPSNPTGWMLNDVEQQAILDFCRHRGLWLIADEVYNRLVYDAPRAPSFSGKINDDDKALLVNSFSKTWAMTGWRLGWLTIPKSMEKTFEMLVEYNFSCVPEPTQRAGIVAARDGEQFVSESVARYRQARDCLLEHLANFPRVTCVRPESTFYSWLSLDGMTDSYAFAEQAIHEAKVGMAPGIAFGPEGEGHLRICFAVDTDLIEQAIDRLGPMLR